MAHLGAILGALGTVGLLLLPRRVVRLGGLALLGAAEGLLAAALVPGRDLEPLVGSPVRILGVAALAVALLAGAAGLVRFPAAVPVAVLVAAPFRVPVHLGDQKAFLLVPLYAVLSSCTLALVFRTVSGGQKRGVSPLLGVPAALFVGLAALSLLWSDDLRAGTVELLFFLFPFAVLVAAVAAASPAAWAPRALAATLVGLACVFAGIGVSQLWTEDLYFARDLEVANAYTSYFRTTSLFGDSSVYARELVLAICVLLAARFRGRVSLRVALPLIGLLFAGLYFSYSQSSMVALAVAALAVGLLAADRRGRLVLLAGTVAVALAAGAAVAVAAHGHSAQRFTSGRTGLVENTARVFARHPLVGVGIGGQPRASREVKGARKKTERNASHTTPLTVAAELGILGLGAYLAFLAGAGALLAALVRGGGALGLALAGAFVLLVVHSLTYAGFFENPTLWGLLALASAALPAGASLRLAERWQTRSRAR